MLRYVSTVCVKEDGSLMHQDFGANARVPPKSAPGRLENASSVVSLPNQCPGPPPSLSVHYLHLQSVINQLNPHITNLQGGISSCTKCEAHLPVSNFTPPLRIPSVAEKHQKSKLYCSSHSRSRQLSDFGISDQVVRYDLDKMIPVAEDGCFITSSGVP